MDERKACELLKQRFEQVGYAIEENRAFDEDGVTFEIDGFDPVRRVGYEYVTREAGDDWDVDGAVISALDARRTRGELHVLIVDEAAAPDAAALGKVIDVFLSELPTLLDPSATKTKKTASKDSKDVKDAKDTKPRPAAKTKKPATKAKDADAPRAKATAPRRG